MGPCGSSRPSSRARIGPRADGRHGLPALGEMDRAFERLQLAFQIREPGLLFLKVSPWGETLRSDPRYDALAEKLGLG